MLKVVHSTEEPARPISDRERWAMQVLRETYTPAEIMELQANLTGHDLDILAQAAQEGRPLPVATAIGILW